jgi:gliding motility-associated-like protein
MHKSASLLVVFLLLFANKLFCQKDTSFWFAAPAIVPTYEVNPTPNKFRVISYGQAATVTLSEPANPAFVTYTVILQPYSSADIVVGPQIGMIENQPTNTVLNYGIHISATAKISCYYEINQNRNSGIFSLKGNAALGNDFTIPVEYSFYGNHKGFVLVASEDNTVIKIRSAGTNLTFIDSVSISLSRGQTYASIGSSWKYIQNQINIAGTNIVSNKPLSVTFYEDDVNYMSDGSGNCGNLLGDQMVPASRAGYDHMAVRGELSIPRFPPPFPQTYDYLMMMQTTLTTISWSIPGGSFQDPGSVYGAGPIIIDSSLSNTPSIVFVSPQVLAWQLTGVGCKMSSATLPTILCNGSREAGFIRSTNEPLYINILCREQDTASFLVNGKPGIITSAMFKDVPANNGPQLNIGGKWEYARLSFGNFNMIDKLFKVDSVVYISNTTGIFKAGFLNGGLTSARYLYYTDYDVNELAPKIIGNQCLGNDIGLVVKQTYNTSYHWEGPNGFVSDTGYYAIIHNAPLAAAGTYYVTANVPDCPTVFTDSIQVPIYTKASGSLPPDDSICIGGSKQVPIVFTGKAAFTLSYSDSSAAGINIHTVNNIGQSPYTFLAAPTTTTLYRVLAVKDSLGCTLPLPNYTPNPFSYLIVHPNPTVTMSGVDSICLGAVKNLQFRFTGKAPFHFTYTDGSTVKTVNASSNTYQVPISPMVNTIYTVTALSDSNACAMSDSVSYAVKVLTIRPKSFFSVSNEACNKAPIPFKDSTLTNGVPLQQWFWDFGDGSTDSVANPIKKYSIAKNYTIHMYSINSIGCSSDTAVKQITIDSLPVAGFTASAPLYCELAPVSFASTAVSVTGTISRWFWDLKDGTLVDTINGNPFNHQYAHAGNYPVRMMVQNDKGCRSDTLVKQVIIHPSPQVGFITPKICIADGLANFIDSSSIADGSQAQFSYQWSFDAASALPAVAPANYPSPLVSTNKNPAITYKQAANYTVQLTVSSSQGCIATKTQPFTVNGSSPVSLFSVNNAAKLCGNDSVQISNLSTVDFGNISWVEIYWDNIGSPAVKEVDSFPFLNKIYKHLYPLFQQPTKNYQVRLAAYSGGACVNGSTQNITLTEGPKAVFTGALPGICNDTMARQITQVTELSGIAGSGLFSGAGISAGGLFNPAGLTPGTYLIHYTYNAVNGCADTASAPITVWPLPIAKWGISNPVCEKNGVVFTDSSVSTVGKIVQWQWDFGDGNTLVNNNGKPVTNTYSNAMHLAYNAALKVVTDSGCGSLINTQAVAVHYLPKPAFIMPAVCLPGGQAQFVSSSTIADSSSNLFSYLWKFDNANGSTYSTLQSTAIKYTSLPPSGGYAVQLKITSKDGCTDSVTQYLTTLNPQPKAAFSISPAQPCTEDPEQLNDLSDGKGATIVKWLWTLPQGNSSSLQNPVAVFTDSGMFSISLVAYNSLGCMSDTAVKTITVYPKPTVKLGANVSVLQGNTIQLNPVYISGNQLSFIWSPDTYLDSSTVLHPIVSPPGSIDSIQYKLTVSATGNCSASDSIYVVVLKTPGIITNAFSPNGDGINDTWIIKNIENYPNAKVEVYSRSGQLVFSSTGYNNSKAWDGKLNGKPLPIGTYYYIINPRNGKPILEGSVTILR